MLDGGDAGFEAFTQELRPTSHYYDDAVRTYACCTCVHVYMSIIMLLCDLQSVQALDVTSGPDWLARQFWGGEGGLSSLEAH